LQPGEFYFQCGLKIAIFGIGDDARLKQTNYLLAEPTADMGKGVDVTASMLYDYVLTNESMCSAETVIFNTDNCMWLGMCILRSLTCTNRRRAEQKPLDGLVFRVPRHRGASAQAAVEDH
jgi:hypothetical protein